MNTPHRNTKSLEEIKNHLYSLYLEYKRLNNTKEDPRRLDNLITIIFDLEYELIKHLRFRNNNK